jgi:hypothetical protein
MMKVFQTDLEQATKKEEKEAEMREKDPTLYFAPGAATFNVDSFRDQLNIPPTIVQWGHTPTLSAGGFLHVRPH